MGSDKHLEHDSSTATVPSPFTDSVITSRESQTAYHSSRQSTGGPQELHLADNQFLKIEDGYSNPMMHDLVYRTTVDPVQEHCGDLLASFDSITDKMSHMFKDPLIKSEDGFTGNEVADVVHDPSKMAKFSQLEQDTLKVLNENSDKFFGDPKLRLTRQTVVDYAEKTGILKRT
jgi:hypothetical protein